MADAAVKATIGGREPVTIHVIIGDGVAGYWTVALHEGGRVVRRWEGRSDDALADTVVFPAGWLTDAHSLTWSVVLYGPARKTPYRVELTVTEGQHSALGGPVRLHGEVEARKTATLSGTLDIERSA